MANIRQKTSHNFNPEKKWVIIDAKDANLGRLASFVASKLRGKDKTTFSPFIDCGDYVVVINAKLITTTGQKLDQKTYYHYSGYPGGLKETKLKDLLNRKPEFPLMHAVKGMLPKNKLGNKILKNLRVFAGVEHTHQSQKPLEIKIN